MGECGRGVQEGRALMWVVEFHPDIFESDFKKVDQATQQQLIKTILKKLSSHPKEYGAPLAGSLHGYWKLKIGFYRVVYRIEEKSVVVQVIAIGLRRNFEAYDSAFDRILRTTRKAGN